MRGGLLKPTRPPPQFISCLDHKMKKNSLAFVLLCLSAALCPPNTLHPGPSGDTTVAAMHGERGGHTHRASPNVLQDERHCGTWEDYKASLLSHIHGLFIWTSSCMQGLYCICCYCDLCKSNSRKMYFQNQGNDSSFTCSTCGTTCRHGGTTSYKWYLSLRTYPNWTPRDTSYDANYSGGQQSTKGRTQATTTPLGATLEPDMVSESSFTSTTGVTLMVLMGIFHSCKRVHGGRM